MKIEDNALPEAIELKRRDSDTFKPTYKPRGFSRWDDEKREVKLEPPKPI